MKFSKWFYIFSFLLVAGCLSHGPRIDWNDTQSIATQISISRDDYKELTTYQGPWHCGKDKGWYLIRAWKYDKDDKVTYQIYIKDYYNGDWGLYGSAYDSDGNQLNTVEISRETDSCIGGSCWFYHPLGVNVDSDYFEKYKESGISFRLFEKTGENVFFVPPAYVKALLDAVN